MNCKDCKNYEPRTQEPVTRPGRVLLEDLRIGMVVRVHGTKRLWTLFVVKGVRRYLVKSLLLKCGLEPLEGPLDPVMIGLSPDVSGCWREGIWCEEVPEYKPNPNIKEKNED